MNQQIRINLLGCPSCQLDVGSVHRVPRLKCDDPRPSTFFEYGSKLRGGVPESSVCVMLRRTNPFQRTSDVALGSLIENDVDTRVERVRRPEHLLNFIELVRLPNVTDRQDGRQHAFGVH